MAKNARRDKQIVLFERKKRSASPPVPQPTAVQTRPSPASFLPPSKEGFARHVLLLWVRRAMILCTLLVVLLTAAVPLLSLAKVKSIAVEGCVHYSEEELLSALTIQLGDDVLAISKDDICATLLSQFPYLLQVSVDHSFKGSVTIRVEERKVQWALHLPDGQVALVDDDMYILELGDSELAGEYCTVKLSPVKEVPPSEENGEEAPSLPTVGKQYQGDEKVHSILRAIEQATSELILRAPMMALDFSDPYMAKLHLRDGTTYFLHECQNVEEQLKAGTQALETYLSATGAQGSFAVDVDDFCHVTLRPMAKKEP